MNWDKLRVFHATVESGSFTQAGDALNLSQSAISRQISQLEQSLKAPLFHRHSRGLKLTEQGEVLHRAVGDVKARLSMAEAIIVQHRECPRGPLRVSTTVAFGAFWLAPRLKEFHDLYPEITVTLLLDGGTADLAMREADVAICMFPPQKQDLVQRRILCSRSFAFASPDYLRRHGTPCQAEELDDHRIIGHWDDASQDASETQWLLNVGATAPCGRQPVAMLDNVYGLYRAAASGLGIVSLPYFIEPEATGIVRILKGLSSPKTEGYFVYPSELKQSKCIAVFRDFLLRKIARALLHLDPLPT